MSSSITNISSRITRGGNLLRMHVQTFHLGDIVRTPLGHEARVVDWQAGRCDLEYVDSALGGVVLDAAHLRLVSRGD